ncbi:MAG: NUDIX domain-containing protein [Planctomycetes bacterium]|nr:NUDIX domain-containing protein [Planctomycetota bacterium]
MKDRSAVIIVRDEKLLLLHRTKGNNKYYSIPGGRVEAHKDETPEQTAIREIREETTLCISGLHELCRFENQDRMEFYFIAEKATGDAVMSGPELAKATTQNRYKLEWVPLPKVRKIKLLPEKIKEIITDMMDDGKG